LALRSRLLAPSLAFAVITRLPLTPLIGAAINQAQGSYLEDPSRV
jgi:hypothetical protein